MSLTPLPPSPPLSLEKSIFFALPSTNGPLPYELKFRENTVLSVYLTIVVNKAVIEKQIAIRINSPAYYYNKWRIEKNFVC